jgi:hypothetical protein
VVCVAIRTRWERRSRAAGRARYGSCGYRTRMPTFGRCAIGTTRQWLWSQPWAIFSRNTHRIYVLSSPGLLVAERADRSLRSVSRARTRCAAAARSSIKIEREQAAISWVGIRRCLAVRATDLIRMRTLVATTVNQQRASAQGDLVGGDKNVELNIYGANKSAGIVEQLIEKLRAEMEANEQIKHTIEQLQYFEKRQSEDGIEGLVAKLEAGGRAHECQSALEQKELFAKLLDKWSLYASAQEIFAYLLAKAEYEFNYFVRPQLKKLDELGVNQLVNDRIVQPALDQCASSVFPLNHSIVMGMIYWLAEQCRVRWHA